MRNDRQKPVTASTTPDAIPTPAASHTLESRAAVTEPGPVTLPAGCPVRIGDVFEGKYLIQSVLGVGGMGVVVAARHLVLEQPVAIKFLLREGWTDGASLMRFQREARAIARIKSAHVVRVMDVAETPSGVPYIVMEHLVGRDLDSVLEQSGALPFRRAATFILEACDALGEAHGQGIVHRDLKPANLFVCSQPGGVQSIKVLDFGIAKDVSVPANNLTTTRTLMGSPLYMSPEQMACAGDLDLRVDIWALGAVLYELLAGRPAFGGPTLAALALAIATEEPLPLRELQPGVPDGLARIIARCLAKDRVLRYGSVLELAIALAPFAEEEARSVVTRLRRLSAADAVAPLSPDAPNANEAPDAFGNTKSPTDHALERKRNKRWQLIVAAIVLALGALTSIAAHLIPRETQATAVPAPSLPIAGSQIAAAPQPSNSESNRGVVPPPRIPPASSAEGIAGSASGTRTRLSPRKSPLDIDLR